MFTNRGPPHKTAVVQRRLTILCFSLNYRSIEKDMPIEVFPSSAFKQSPDDIFINALQEADRPVWPIFAARLVLKDRSPI